MDKRVVFLCVDNANRSQLAEAFTRMYGTAKVEAFSAGLRPVDRLDRKVVEAMEELAYDMTQHQPKRLNELPDVEFDVLVTMGCTFEEERAPLKTKRIENWDVPDPKDMSAAHFRVVRGVIEIRVKELLARL